MKVQRLISQIAVLTVAAGCCAGAAFAESADRNDPRLQLLEAIARDDARAVQNLLLAGVSPNVREADRGPAMLMAVTEGSDRAAVELLKSPHVDVEATGKNGETPIMAAAIAGNQGMVQRLIEKGARLDAPGWTALHYAAGNGDTATVETLVAAGATLNARAPDGTTPLIVAARNRHLTAYQTLLLAGADPRLANEANMNAADYLDKQGDSERASELRAYMKTFAKMQSSVATR